MRHSFYRHLLSVIVLLAGLSVAAPAQAPNGTNQSHAAVAQTTGAEMSPANSSSSMQAINAPGQENGAQDAGRVERAGMIPDSGSLLPVAAVVGFSFLLGGIVCGTIKKRP